MQLRIISQEGDDGTNEKLKVAILGATGVVGQHFVRMLEDHPTFHVVVLAASEKSAGQKYGSRVDWVAGGHIPQSIAGMPIEDISDMSLGERGIRIAFSALPAETALEVERQAADAGVAVFSNASAHRMDHDVPILIPEVNPHHLRLVELQRKKSPGFIVANSNCTASGLVLALYPLLPYHPTHVAVTTYQALSGAGLPGVPSLEILGNVVPHIDGEEEKVEHETRKMLGTLGSERIEDAPFEVCASCARVPVRDGHLESVLVEFEEPINEQQMRGAFQNFSGLADFLPTAPLQPLIVRLETNRPQPTLDLWAGSPPRAAGMAVSIGRIKVRERRARFFLLVNNTVRGAAGASILNAEFALEKGYILSEG